MHRKRRFPGGGRTACRVLQLTCICFFLATTASCLDPQSDQVRAATPPAPTFEAAVSDYYHGRFGSSIFMLERLIDEHPAETRPRWELANLFEEAGNYRAAIRTLKGLYGPQSDSAKVENAIFVARVLDGQHEDALSMLPLGKETFHTVFYEALLRMELGQDSKAAALFRKSLQMHEPQPMGWYFLGQLNFTAGDFSAAQSNFETVRKQNPDLTIAIPPLARAILAQKKTTQAYPLLLRARNILPENRQLKEDIARIEKEFPQLVKARAQESALQRRYAVAPRVTTFPKASKFAPLIRVGLAEDLASLTIKTGGAYQIRTLTPASALTYHGTAGQLLELRKSGAGIELSIPGQKPFLTWTAPVSLTYTEPSSTTEVFDLVTGKGSFYATSGNRAYRGEMIFRPGPKGFTVVNRLPLEEYLYSVLPSEMFSFWPMAALKAQAVAARSYTLASIGAHSAKGFDVYGSVLSAAYEGAENEAQATTEAVNATAGQILAYHTKPLKAYYSANSGGYTENSTVVWGGGPQGMAAVPDLRTEKRTRYLSLTGLISWLEGDPASYSAVPAFNSPSSYRWVKWVPARKIERSVDKAKQVGRILAIITRGRGISGRVEEIEVIGTLGSATFRGDHIRSLLGNLRSTLFTVRPKMSPDGAPQYFIFTGGGWGHGVGMDQDGAAGMAAAGYSYKQILSHYYPLARLVELSTWKGDRADLGVQQPATPKRPAAHARRDASAPTSDAAPSKAAPQGQTGTG